MSSVLDLVMVKGAYDRAGGPETVLQQVAGHLDRERVRPLLVLLSRVGQDLPPVLAEVAASLPTARLPWHGLVRSPATAVAIGRLLRERPGAVLHTNDMRSDLLAYMITRVRRVPWIAHVHGWLRETHSGRHKLYEDLDRWLVRGADLVLVGSQAMADEVRKAGVRRVEIVTNGIPAGPAPETLDAEAAAIRSRVAPDGGLIAGILGRLHAGKGHALLIESVANLGARGRNVRALFVGEGPAEAEYREQAARLGVSDRIVFAGLVPEIRPYLRAMDIACVPSLKDSLPLTALEAMSVGRPVIASRAGDLPLAIEDGRNGLLVEVGSATALEAAVERLIADPALRERLGAAGRHTLLTRYSPDAMLRQLEGYCLGLREDRARAA